jgi:hypothetical protein
LNILLPVSAHEHRPIQIYGASLTTQMQREFACAELAIAKWLKSFLEVGMALNEKRKGPIAPQKTAAGM